MHEVNRALWIAVVVFALLGVACGSDAAADVTDDERQDTIAFARGLGVDSAVGDNDIVERSASYCERLRDGEPFAAIIESLASIESDGEGQTEVALLLAGIGGICVEYEEELVKFSELLGGS